MTEGTITTTVVNFDKSPTPPKLSSEEKARLDSLTDEDIARSAATDPDNPILTEAELAEFNPVAEAKLIRQSLKLTQKVFCEIFDIPIGTLRDWEQHRTEPDKAAQNFLKMISVVPDTVKQTLSDFKLIDEHKLIDR